MDDGSKASGCPFLSRNVDDAYFLLEDMESYNYHWYLSLFNVEKHKDPLEDFEKTLEEIEEGTREIREMREFNHQHDILTISLDDELVQEPM